MKIALLIFSTMALLALGCNRFEKDQQSLAMQREEILNYALQSTCEGEGQCRFIALGEKACGGPQRYLVYGIGSIDTLELRQKVDAYNKAERDFNRKWDIVSTCDVPVPPDTLLCADGRCMGD